MKSDSMACSSAHVGCKPRHMATASMPYPGIWARRRVWAVAQAVRVGPGRSRQSTPPSDRNFENPSGDVCSVVLSTRARRRAPQRESYDTEYTEYLIIYLKTH